MDRYDRRPFVVRLGQEEARLQPRPVGVQRVEVALQIGLQPVAGVTIGLGQLGDLDQRARAGLQVAPGADLLAQLIGPAQHRLRRVRVIPEVGIGRFLGQLRELGLLGGQVKGAPPCRPRGARAAAPRP